MNLKSVLSSITPFIGSLFGSPLAGVALKALGSLLLGDENATQDQIEKELSKISPECLVKLKQIDSELKSKFIEACLDEKKIEAFDRDSARNREISSNDKMPAILAILLTCGFFGIILIMVFFTVPQQSISLVNIMIGSIGTAWTSCITYYFGSSSGSKMKNELFGGGYGKK